MFDNKSKNNLHSLYHLIGTDNNLSLFSNNLKYEAIQAIDSVWPNTNFNFDPNCLTESSFIEELNSHILNKKSSNLLLQYDCEFDYDLLKKNGYYSIEQWNFMELDIQNFQTKNSENCFEANTKNEILSWKKRVEENLFKNKTLSNSLLEFLLNKNCNVYYLQKDELVIATTLTYFDENNVAGIYMVSTNQNERGKGFGSNLMHYTINKCLEKNANGIVLQSTRAGFNIYKKIGFIDTGICNLIYKIK